MTTPNHYATTQWWRKAASLSGEARLSAAVRAQLEYGHDFVFPGIPFNIELDGVAFEYRLAHGRVGAAVFHADGSLTLVEMKDGAAGMAPVVSGIGQVTMNALNSSMRSGHDDQHEDGPSCKRSPARRNGRPPDVRYVALISMVAMTALGTQRTLGIC